MNGYETEEQRQLIERQRQLFARTIEDETENSRLAHKIIPKYSLAASARAVSAARFDYGTGRVDDETQLALKELQQQFSLTRQQAEDADLASAAVVIRRAAQLLAQDHDREVFKVSIRDPINDADAARKAKEAKKGKKATKASDVVEGVDRAEQEVNRNFNLIVDVDRIGGSGEGLVPATAAAVATLDGLGYRTGYVMVAGQEVYTLLHTRAAGAADLPIVAVRGLLADGPVHRSGVLPIDEAEILSMGSAEGPVPNAEALGPIDRAVAYDPRAEFLRIEEIDRQVGGGEPLSEEIRTWEVHERFITRFKETKSVVLLRLKKPGTTEPGTTEPGTTEPGTTEPGTAGPDRGA